MVVPWSRRAWAKVGTMIGSWPGKTAPGATTNDSMMPGITMTSIPVSTLRKDGAAPDFAAGKTQRQNIRPMIAATGMMAKCFETPQ